LLWGSFRIEGKIAVVCFQLAGLKRLKKFPYQSGSGELAIKAKPFPEKMLPVNCEQN
jgi:hypothetical protein